MQQEAVIFLARELIATDDAITAKEQDVLDQMVREVELPMPSARYLSSHGAAVEALTTGKARAIAIIELLGIAHADGEYGEEERCYIQDLVQELGVPETTVTAMENWVLRYVALTDEAKGFWFE
ncbi:MAG: hypothetical protein KKB90_12485 [Actinobacteria bacterium]|nr:hypothetical protein [Actinomycetota bacterium]MCG2817901.1 hypothetical protein [Actinomycetes bacterium]MBU4219762.1 hypothetical protein [Actinomycetota bacterium]MBU4357830.1 hypothetical protein [Actinomycetota bacterium]MBU4392657.1 hypothetical protein [Actinomycetota bacterium]